MKYAIVYSSRTGNTGTLAGKIKEVLPEDDCIYFGEPDDKALEAPLQIVGFWTDKGTCDEKTGAYLEKLSDKKILLFGTAGFGGDPAYYEGIIGRLEAHLPKTETVGGWFMCQGAMPVTVKQRYETMLEKEPENPHYAVMVHNFDAALGHPDEADLSNLTEWLKAQL